MNILPKYKHLLCYIIFLVVFTIAITIFFFYPKENKKFNDFCTNLFIQNITANPLSLHFTLAYPEHYCISVIDPVLPTYTKIDSVSTENNLLAQLDYLSDIDITKLNDWNAYTYTLLKRSLNLSLENLSFPYYGEPLSPTSGMQSQLPILLAEYAFRSKNDIDNYLSILASSGNYFDSLLTYEKEKKEADQFMSYNSAMELVEQCNQIITASDLKTNQHFLQTTFNERINLLLLEDAINTDEANQYIQTNNNILMSIVLPAYENIALTINQLADTSINAYGLAHYPLGQEYYSYLLKNNVGSYLSIQELKNSLTTQLEKERAILNTLCTSYPNALIFIDNTHEPTLSFNTPENMIEDVQQRMVEDFPPLDTNNNITYEIKNVSTSLQNYTSPAFYLTPPIDDVSQNVIYINPKNSPSDISLYTTLAHEGYPGHLYQSVYHLLLAEKNNLHPLHELLWYPGFLEGWALYVEFISYDYLATHALETNNIDLSTYITIEKHNRQMQLCLLSILDVAIHFDGANYQKVHSILSSYGITDPKVTFHIYEYICNEPTTYLKYYLGYLEILKLKELAKETNPIDYSDYDFHCFLLNYGPADFPTLTQALEANFLSN